MVRALISSFLLASNHYRRAFPKLLLSTPVLSMSSTTTTPDAESTTTYVPPEVWTYVSSDGSKMTMNRPTAGSRFEKELTVGKHPIQLYSLGTPNGQKVTILLEELLADGHNCEYDAWFINIMESEQFGSGFVEINPNSKIPTMRIHEDGKNPLDLFESGSMMLHLAEKFKSFIPEDMEKRTAALNWLFWQMGAAPYVGGGFGHFFTYANEKQQYPIDRFTMETKRQLDVLNNHLQDNKYMVGDTYTIADMAIFPWYGRLVQGKLYPKSDVFLNVVEDYPNVIRWADMLGERPAVQRGLRVNSPWNGGIKERHDASDLDKKPEDKERKSRGSTRATESTDQEAEARAALVKAATVQRGRQRRPICAVVENLRWASLHCFPYTFLSSQLWTGPVAETICSETSLPRESTSEREKLGLGSFLLHRSEPINPMATHGYFLQHQQNKDCGGIIPMAKTETCYSISNPHAAVFDEPVLDEHDVLCGRCRTAFNHVGNQKFRILVSLQRDLYGACTNRKGKSTIIKGIIAEVRGNGGRFLRFQNDRLVELTAKEVHAKVGHAFRDMVMASRKATSTRPERLPEPMIRVAPRVMESEEEAEAVRTAAAALFGIQ